MLLEKLLSGLDYSLNGVSGGIEITLPFSDSRCPIAGGLFICLESREEIAKKYVLEAMAGGAACAVMSQRCTFAPSVRVRDGRFAAAVIWNNYYSRPAEKMKLYGITGTNGKTSTLRFLASCLRADGRQVGTIGTLGCFAGDERLCSCASEKIDGCSAMTTPDPACLYRVLSDFQKRGITDVVMEVSSHAIAQRKVDALNFCIGIFTNLTPEHLDFHKSMEDYFRTKASFVARCPLRVVNADDPECRRFAAAVPSCCVSQNDVRELRSGLSGVSYTAVWDETVRVRSSVGGGFTVTNTLLAVKAARLAGVSLPLCEKGIADVENVSGRLERVVGSEKWGFDVVIDYAHTPAALEGVLSELLRITEGRLICVFGCGGDRDKTKRPLMGKIAQRYCDAVIVTSDNPRGEDPFVIIRDITEGMADEGYVVIPNRKNAIIAAISMADKGDTVLLAGKGHETYEIVGKNVVSFDEREAVREALRLKTTND